MQVTERPEHEETDANIRGVALTALGLAAVTALALGVVLLHFTLLRNHELRGEPPPSPLAAERPEAPPEPRLQPAPVADLGAVRAAEDQALQSYGWVDRPQGVVRIPIARAKELVAKEAAR